MALTLAGTLIHSPVGAHAAQRISNDAFPPECLVESWCVLSSTECFVPYVDHTNGFSQAISQFSVVRKGVLLCPVPYSSFPERRNIQGPVESASYRSEVFTDDEKAKEQAMSICNRYRTDWLAAAPACKN